MTEETSAATVKFRLTSSDVSRALARHTFRKMSDNMDVNAGPIADGEKDVHDVGAEILHLVLEVASGRKTCAERLGHPAVARVVEVHAATPAGAQCALSNNLPPSLRQGQRVLWGQFGGTVPGVVAFFPVFSRFMAIFPVSGARKFPVAMPAVRGRGHPKQLIEKSLLS